MTDPIVNYKFTVTVNGTLIGITKVTGLSEFDDFKYLRLTRPVTGDADDQFLLNWFRGEKATKDVSISVAGGAVLFLITGVEPTYIEYGELNASVNQVLSRVFEFTYDKLAVTP